jgi:hypothetical protein
MDDFLGVQKTICTEMGFTAVPASEVSVWV